MPSKSRADRTEYKKQSKFDSILKKSLLHSFEVLKFELIEKEELFLMIIYF